MKTIIAISAGHDSSKKVENRIRSRIRYLNYGLLGLATILKHQGGIDIIVYQADSYNVDALFDVIERSGINIISDCECFLLSIPSYYSMSWSIKFCEAVRQRYQKKVIVGGRWVVDNHVDWVKEQLKYVDVIIEGFGEKKLAQYFNLPNCNEFPDGSTKCFDWLDYTLLYEYTKYQPCIEISRGCGAGCQFCADKSNMRLQNKSIDLVMYELDYLNQTYGSYSVYFEAPHFSFEPMWIKSLCNRVFSRNQQFMWRCTSRVESVPISFLSMMSAAGLKVLDIGLESASPQQLINMKKTKSPKKYLDLADKLLVACAKNGIWVKFNLLLYAGETYQTINETTKWLIDRKELIKDVSVSNLVYYYNMDSILELQKLGASIPYGNKIEKNGFVELNLSHDIDRDTAKQLSVDIPKLIANQKDFYEIKTISYFEPGYSYLEFIEDVKHSNRSSLPFSVDFSIDETETNNTVRHIQMDSASNER